MAPGQQTSRLNHQGRCQKHFLPPLALSLLLSLLAMASTSPLYAQTPTTAISKDLRSALEYYLDADCGSVPKDPAALNKPFGALLTLLQIEKDPNLEARLLEILRRGFYPEYKLKMETMLGNEWEKTEVKKQAATKNGTKKPFPRLTKENYVAQHLKWRLKENQQKAAVALALLNTPRAKKALAAVKDKVLADTIKHSYKRFGLGPGAKVTAPKPPRLPDKPKNEGHLPLPR